LAEPAAAAGRFIAEHHQLEVVTPESQLQNSWAAIVAFCGTIECEVVSSTITTRTGGREPSGAIAMRVVPADLQKLLDRLQTAGQVATHTTERVDKTTQVIDTEAKIKNLTDFRDSLRFMLGKSSATVADVVQIREQLTDTQSQLDSETAQRKILANETEKVAVDVAFRIARSNENGGSFSEIGNALRESGSVLADSTASLITTIVAVLPWLVVVLPIVWLLGRAWRRIRESRKRPPAPAPPR